MITKFLRDRRRRGLLEIPISAEWMEILDTLRFVQDLEGDERQRFLDQTKVFAREKRWIPAGGLEEVTTEMRVVISACAARLVRNLPLDSYDRLTEVVVYPESFALGGDDHREILGLAHPWGTVVLAWDAVRRGIATNNDGHNTAVHEFAHALDVEDGVYDGTPILERGADYKDWVEVLGHHFAVLQETPLAGVVRDYGATNEAEFFAVATEEFFEQPKRLQREAPDLYAELAQFYAIDPAD